MEQIRRSMEQIRGGDSNSGGGSGGGSMRNDETVVRGDLRFDGLPEECISKIISHTSPKDACVVGSVSKTVKSAAESDLVWAMFLQPEFHSLVPGLANLSSKKEIYLSLANDSVLVDDGKKSLGVEKASGKMYIMLSAMDMSIVSGNDPQYWKWIQIPESRFERVGEILHAYWFEVRCKTSTGFLSPRTRYSAYIVFKEKDHSCGFKGVPVEVELGVVGQEVSKRLVYFDVDAKERKDGWMEVELGDFFNEGGLVNCDEIEILVLEHKRFCWKRGLILQGIEIRPAKIL